MASPPLSDFDTPSPLQRAAYLGNITRLKRLVKQVEKDHKDKGGNIGDVLGKLFDGDGFTVLHTAASNGRIKICKYLIKELNIKVDVPSRYEEATPLHRAILRSHRPTAVYLLDNGANVNATCKNGSTPLHYAAKKGFEELMKLLLSRGAEINAMCYSGTPLQLAADGGKKECVKILLDNHADPNAVHHLMYSPLVAAVYAKSIECVKILLQAGAKPSIRSDRVMPLEAAVAAKETELIKCLLAAGANPDTRNILGLTPLEIAAIEGQHEDVLVLFPATAPIAGITDWSVGGIMQYVQTEEARKKREDKKKEAFLLSKSKGEAAVKSDNYGDAVHYYSECHRLEPRDPAILQERAACWSMLDNEGDRGREDIMVCLANMFKSGGEVTVEVRPLSAEEFQKIEFKNRPK